MANVAMFFGMTCLLPMVGSGLAGYLLVGGWPGLGLLVCVVWTGLLSVGVGSAYAESSWGPVAGAVVAAVSSVSATWWFHPAWVPLILLTALACSVLGLTSRNLPQHQGVAQLAGALLAILTCGLLGNTGYHATN